MGFFFIIMHKKNICDGGRNLSEEGVKFEVETHPSFLSPFSLLCPT